MKISLVKFKSSVVFTDEKLGELSEFLQKNKEAYSSCVLISSDFIYAKFGKEVRIIFEKHFSLITPLLLPEGEDAKNLGSVASILEKMHAQGHDRETLVVALGGGSVTDTAGFIASCYMRGVDTLYIPTTLLAMVDASIGGKTGVNLPSGKNIVGAFHHPRLVVISPHFLNTLPERQFSSGLAEVIKAAMVWDSDFVDFLINFMPKILARDKEKVTAAISRACKVKAEIIKIDEKEKNTRFILNYGHTFAHALETVTQYKLFTHGEAVSIGMSLASHVSYELGFVSQEFIEAQDALLLAAKLPINLPKEIRSRELLHQMSFDKKAIKGKIILVLPRKIGKVEKIVGVDPLLIGKVIEKKMDVR